MDDEGEVLDKLYKDYSQHIENVMFNDKSENAREDSFMKF